jgi:hypothetical protein
MTADAISLNFDGGAGRALLVAALLVSAYALTHYWRSLRGRSLKVRYTLILLRAVTFILMSFLLAGVRIEYESAARARVLLREASDGRASATGLEELREHVKAALLEKGFEVVEADDESHARTTTDDGSFVAGVLLTDAALSAAKARLEVERTSVAADGTPAYVMTNDGMGQAPGVALESVMVLGRAVRGVPVAVRVVIHARGMRGRESLVTIADDAKVQASARVAWTSDDERQASTLTVVPKVAGWVDYSAKVEAAAAEDAELLTRSFTVYTKNDSLRVLFFESEPTWEAKFIRRALEQSGLFEVYYFARVSRAATAGISAEATEQASEPTGAEDAGAAGAKRKIAASTTPEARLRAALQSAAELNSYDCVIVGAAQNTLLSTAESARLREWVERRGGGLVLLGGNSFNGSIIAPGGKLYPLLPAEMAAQSFPSQSEEVSSGRPVEAEQRRGGVQLTPTEAGAGGALSGYLSASEEITLKMGALTGQGLRLSALRPGATLLAVGGPAGATGTSETGTPLIAAMRYGMGRTLVFAPADSWRIRTSASGDQTEAGGPFNALWQGIVLWTTAGARPPAEIALSDESPAEGSTVAAEIRVRDAAFAPLKIEKLSARLQPLTEAASEDSPNAAQPREINFAPDASDMSVWRARFPLRARGRFVLEIDYTAGGRSGTVEKHFAVMPPRAQQAGAALDSLRRLARQSGGELINADASALAARLSAEPPGTERVRRTWELRKWWPLALLLPLLLSAEWFLRRWWRVD